MFSNRSLKNILVVVFASGIAACAQNAATRASPNTPDMQEMRNYRLSMDKVDKFAAASHNLMILTKAHPEMRAAMGDQTGVKTIDESVARLQSKFPQAAGAIQKSGLTVRDYILTSVSLMTATMAMGMKKQGQLKQAPPSVSPENLAFVEQNYAKVEKVMRSLSQANAQ